MKKFLSILVRCKDEPFIEEFADYYFTQGIDFIHILDDSSELKYSNKLKNNNKVKIYNKIDIGNDLLKVTNILYSNIRFDTEYLMFIDADEFIRTNTKNTIKEEIKKTFSKYDVIKIPWVMFSCNKRENDPKSITNDLVWRWNHDKKHPHKYRKFRCRFRYIEVKSIFKTSMFTYPFIEKKNDHVPNYDSNKKYNICNSINPKKNRTKRNMFYKLREKDIKRGFMVCHHYRLFSKESIQRKIETNMWYKKYSFNDIIDSDHNEIKDTNLVNSVYKL